MLSAYRLAPLASHCACTDAHGFTTELAVLETTLQSFICSATSRIAREASPIVDLYFYTMLRFTVYCSVYRYRARLQ